MSREVVKRGLAERCSSGSGAFREARLVVLPLDGASTLPRTGSSGITDRESTVRSGTRPAQVLAEQRGARDELTTPAVGGPPTVA